MTRGGRQKPAGPERTCVGCRTKKPPAELLRLVAEGGRVVPGAGKPGRGCWLCRDPDCARKALKSGQIPRALKGKAAAPDLAALLEWIGPRSLDGDGGSGLKS
jgi:predicted RNA-binding protein YlxR (DUF448 family)